ncbi:MAG TPA: M20/M25/M40 family metallo-hydrolase [Cyclobacteriaceae bacterium]|jgi:acetylornithine deacetylase/succinyl-diaminopimelate desuccinylase-like protein|nr:M20/M25/M40 family metallo-hydrolase [Cyclobacteriaceae bacterium]
MKYLFLISIVTQLTLISGSVIAQKSKTTTKEDIYASEVKTLAKTKSVTDAFKVIDELEPSTIKELIDLTEIPAPPFKENIRAQRMKQLFETAGADKVWIDSVGNVLALRKGKNSNQTVILDAHLDTVFPEGTDVTIKHHGDTLYAPGVSDDTRGLAVILAVFRSLEKTKVETDADLLFLASVGEEGLGDLRGVKYFLKKNTLKIKSWISVDGTNIDEIATGALGSVRYKATIKGPGGHSWGAFGLGNPHHAMAKAINYFSDEAAVFTSAVGKTSFNVGRTGGGTSVNAIPFESWAEVDMRSESQEYLKKIDSIFKSSMAKGLNEYNKQIKKGQPLTLTLVPIGFRPSGKTHATDPIVQRASAAAALFGATPKLITESTNANIAISKGVPAITVGAGGKSDHAHALNEWWLNDKGADGIKFALLVTLGETGILK